MHEKDAIVYDSMEDGEITVTLLSRDCGGDERGCSTHGESTFRPSGRCTDLWGCPIRGHNVVVVVVVVFPTEDAVRSIRSTARIANNVARVPCATPRPTRICSTSSHRMELLVFWIKLYNIQSEKAHRTDFVSTKYRERSSNNGPLLTEAVIFVLDTLSKSLDLSYPLIDRLVGQRAMSASLLFSRDLTSK